MYYFVFVFLKDGYSHPKISSPTIKENIGFKLLLHVKLISGFCDTLINYAYIKG